VKRRLWLTLQAAGGGRGGVLSLPCRLFFCFWCGFSSGGTRAFRHSGRRRFLRLPAGKTPRRKAEKTRLVRDDATCAREGFASGRIRRSSWRASRRRVLAAFQRLRTRQRRSSRAGAGGVSTNRHLRACDADGCGGAAVWKELLLSGLAGDCRFMRLPVIAMFKLAVAGHKDWASASVQPEPVLVSSQRLTDNHQRGGVDRQSGAPLAPTLRDYGWWCPAMRPFRPGGLTSSAYDCDKHRAVVGRTTGAALATLSGHKGRVYRRRLQQDGARVVTRLTTAPAVWGTPRRAPQWPALRPYG